MLSECPAVATPVIVGERDGGQSSGCTVSGQHRLHVPEGQTDLDQRIIAVLDGEVGLDADVEGKRRQSEIRREN